MHPFSGKIRGRSIGPNTGSVSEIRQPMPREAIRQRIPEAAESDVDIIHSALQHSMTSIERLWALIQSLRYLESRSIPGDVIEFGVWKGGSAYAACSVLSQMGNVSRDVWLYDTFQGMVPPGIEDVRFDGLTAREILERESSQKLNSNNWAISPLEDSFSLVAQSGFPMQRVHFVVGDVRDTLNDRAPASVALARLDTDWFESTRIELERVHPRMSPGGVIIIDDYGHWRGARKAVDEFVSSLPKKPFLHRIDQTGRLWVVD